MSTIVMSEPMSNGLALRRIEGDSEVRFTLGPDRTKSGDIVYYFSEAALTELAEKIREVTS